MERPPAIGLIETSSIAVGFNITDAMLKAASVELVLQRTICPGKFVTLVWGDVAAVEASVAAGVRVGEGFLVNDLVIPNLHPQIFPAMTNTNPMPATEALGVLETFDITTTILSADAAVKAAEVNLIEIRIAMAIGGKGFFNVTGDVAAVEAAIAAGLKIAEGRGQIVASVVIPRPHPDLFKELV